jgi:cyclophilin family peptidyl-prolyl cis-trans isomerase/HEAT repeat protein
MRTHSFNLLCFVLILLAWACSVPEPKEINTLEVDYYNPVHQKIWEFKDQSLMDSLFLYLKSDDPTLRYLSALSFASMETKENAVDSLAYLLNDPVTEVREAAAFALGQLKHSISEIYLTDAFARLDSLNNRAASNQKILEAIGKCGSKKSLQALSTIKTYKTSDSLLICGQIRGIFNFGERGIYAAESIKTATRIIQNKEYPKAARELAAHYLSRAPKTELKDFDLVGLLYNETNPNVKMAMAIALGKTENTAARETLDELIKNETDYRIQLNAIRGLGNFPYDSIHTTLIKSLRNGNEHVRRIAAQQLIDNGNERYAKMYYRLAKDTFPLIIKSTLLTAANKHLPNYFVETKNAVNRQLQQIVEGSFSPQSKLKAVEGLSYDRWNYRYILQQTTHHPDAAMRTAGMQAIKSICKQKDFRKFYGRNYPKVRKEIADSLKTILLSGDDGPVYEGASILNIKDLGFKRVILDNSYLDTALTNLQLPKQIEAYEELKKQINEFRNGRKTPITKPRYNHPIKWDQLEEIRNDEKIVIRTNRGEIILKMMPEVAPATVINFIELVKANFYKNNQFHRVVSNFVIQAGCTRGDGFGSLDHTIRSEFSIAGYEAGMVGMASAGPDTECSQFFITHAQTPQLDGRYTIFAKVFKGMDVVHQIQQGDQIIDIEFLN